MKSYYLLISITFALTFEFAASRVRPPRTMIQHPPLLTRAPPSRLSNAKTTTTTTTPEPPEVDDDMSSSATRRYDRYPNYDFNPFLGLGFFGNYGGSNMAGGASFEVEDEVASTTNQVPKSQGENGRQQPKPRANAVAATAKPTTVKPTTPEPDDDLVAGGSGTASSGDSASSGYCFCSPLHACPFGSVPRGGYCWNFLSYFTNIAFRRCCYRPSLAKYIGN